MFVPSESSVIQAQVQQSIVHGKFTSQGYNFTPHNENASGKTILRIPSVNRKVLPFIRDGKVTRGCFIRNALWWLARVKCACTEIRLKSKIFPSMKSFSVKRVLKCMAARCIQQIVSKDCGLQMGKLISYKVEECKQKDSILSVVGKVKRKLNRKLKI